MCLNVAVAGAAIIFAGLLADPSDISGDDLRLTNITIQLSRSGGPGSRIEAKISNPNDFAVYDVVATAIPISSTGRNSRLERTCSFNKIY